jgi:hypothetical protein
LAITLFAPRVWALSIPTPAAVQGPVKVWVNTGSGVYHCPETRWYGTTKAGIYLSESAARARGYRPASGRTCGPLASPDTALTPTLKSVAPAPTVAVKVWVNTNSGVYHCPGTRYYGNTAKGKYMSEADARVAGNRAAYGRSCS